MPFQEAFSASQSGLTPNIITLTDDSTGSDAAIASRRVYFQTTTGSFLVPSGNSTDYVAWSYADASAAFNIMNDIDYALAVRVDWLDSGGNILYTLTQLYCFPQNNKNFFYYLFQQQALSPIVVQDSNYYLNLATYWANIIGAIQAIEIGADIANSQNCLNRATNMMNNENMYF